MQPALTPEITPETVKAVRIREKLTQYDLSDKTGIPQPCLSRFESGGRNLSPENYAKLREYITKLSPAPEKNVVKNGTEAHPAAIGKVIDDALIDATTNQVIENLLDNIENIVEHAVKTAKIHAGALFTGECTIAEMETILATAETKLTGEVAFTLRDILEDAKISEN